MQVKQTLFKLSEFLSITFLVIVAGISCFALYSKFTHHRGLQLLSVVSGSMHPRIPVGAAVFVIPQKEYFVNDVITYQLNSLRITHRLVYAGNFYLTKGDANSEIDARSVNKSQILGKVVFSVPYLGRLQESTKSLFGLISFVWIPSLMIILHETWVVIYEFRKRDQMQQKAAVKSNLALVMALISSGLLLTPNVYAYYIYTNSGISSMVTVGNFSSSPSPSSTPSPSSSASPTPSPTVQPSPTTSATPAPSATPSASPTASPSSCPSGVSGNCGNGAGSNNTVIIENNSTTIINQENNTTINNTVTVNSNTGGNNTGSNTQTNTNVQTGVTVLTIEVTNTTNSNAAAIGQ